MNDTRGKFATDITEMLDTLLESTKLAGGTISLNQLKRMTAIELIAFLAPNGIRFHYSRERLAQDAVTQFYKDKGGV